MWTRLKKAYRLHLFVHFNTGIVSKANKGIKPKNKIKKH